MKRLVFIFAVATSFALTSAYGQLTHLSLEGTVTQKFGGENWPNNGTPFVHIDVFYDAGMTAEPRDPLDAVATYLAGDASANFWKLTYGQGSVTGKIDRISVSDTELWVDSFQMESLTSFNLDLKFGSDLSPSLALPTEPFPALAPRSPAEGMTGYTSTLNFDTQSLAGLDPGSVVVGIDRVNGAGGSQAVPEPSAYAAAAAALLLALCFRRHQKTTTRPQQS